FGVSHEIVPGLQAALEGLSKGDRFEVTLPPEAAFGNRSSEYLLELDKEIFMRDGKLADEVVVGAKLPMMTAEGYRVEGEVIEIGDKIKMDFNHPFAGLTVTYKGEVDEVRDATQEELHPVSGCGGGCGGCGGSCGSDSDCGDNCEGGSCGCK
ncbi:MAG: FKBP-type peptidyl-prolyl cis-trans isomerase, partial [Muribaculaceae bacterium]|nr:FKBP-type peptidyl-prolyl cis-trans isomerase [Muribaculaceae bacterium]